MACLLLSRGTSGGAAEIVDHLRKRDRIRVVSRENLIQTVNRHGELASRIVTSLDRATRTYEAFSRLRRPYVVLMRLALLEHIADDNIVYSGYSAHMLLPPLPHVARVRVCAPMAKRVCYVMHQRECSEEEAREYILEKDEHRLRWARFMYGRDIRDPHLYDVVINPTRMPVEAAANVLLHLLREPELASTERSMNEVERLLLATRVEAELLLDARTRDLEIAATWQDDRLVLIGPYLDPDPMAAVRQVMSDLDMGETDYLPGYQASFDQAS